VVTLSATRARLEATLPASVAAIDGACATAMALLTEHGLDEHAFAVELLLREALTNAIIHGSKSDPSRTVRLSFAIGRDWAVLKVEDDGPGFDWRTRTATSVDDEATHGRGVSIFCLYADHVAFNRRGNRLVLLRRIRRERT
jgi:serine/threonine-protein kinase RsbW